MKTVTFFETREELRELTGLPGDNHDEALWDADFNLDDWDFGFVSDTEWHSGWGWGKALPLWNSGYLTTWNATVSAIGTRNTTGGITTLLIILRRAYD